VSVQQSNAVAVGFVFANKSSTDTLKAIDFNVLDSMNAKLMREVSLLMFSPPRLSSTSACGAEP